MNSIIYKSESRGDANHGWLHSKHSFSFANYYNPERMGFGVLRVLNDDIVAGGEGFGMHPHDNMEIISIPLHGELKHQDNMGNISIIKKGEIQVMSAGSGVFHSEYNNSEDDEVSFLQIWIYPNLKNVKPRYQQISIKELEKENSFYQILTPDSNTQGVWIYQNAWFHLGKFKAGKSETYNLKKSDNGIFLFVIEGQIIINDNILNKRDAIGISETDSIQIQTTETSEILLMEIPMLKNNI